MNTIPGDAVNSGFIRGADRNIFMNGEFGYNAFVSIIVNQRVVWFMQMDQISYRAVRPMVFMQLNTRIIKV